jgi:hypothetical protein
LDETLVKILAKFIFGEPWIKPWKILTKKKFGETLLNLLAKLILDETLAKLWKN